MADARRRTLAHNDSAIPQPSSSLKKRPAPPSFSAHGAHRMSLAPGGAARFGPPSSQPSSSQPSSQGFTSRMSLAPGPSQPTGGMRYSTALGPSQGWAEGHSQGGFLPSASRGDAGFYGRQSMARGPPPGSVRRTSVYGGGRQSVAPSHHQLSTFVPVPHPLSRDPRPVKDKAFFQAMQRALHDHLTQGGYPFPIGPKTLSSPTTKDFQSIFRFLYTDILDPGFVWGKDFLGKPRKFEDEVIMVLKDMRYPVADLISKTQLSSASAPHVWPSMLAMLKWLVDMTETMQSWYTPDICDDPQLAHPSDLKPSEISNWPEKVAYEYASGTYAAFLADQDEYPEQDAELREIYDRHNESIVADVERLEAEKERLAKELRALKEAPSPLAEAQEEHKKMASDKSKFQQVITHFESKKAKMEDIIGKMDAAVETLEKELATQQDENDRIARAVEAQNLSPEEIERMVSTRAQLTSTLEQQRAHLLKVKQKFNDLEIQATKRGDTLETIVRDYTERAERVGVLPAPPDKYAHITFELEYSRAAPLPAEMFASDIKGVIKPELAELRKDTTREHVQLEDEAIALDEQLQQLQEGVVEKREAVERLNNKLQDTLNQTNEEKERIAAELSASNEQLRDTEQMLRQQQNKNSQEMLELDQRYQKLSFIHDDLIAQTQQAQQEASQEVVAIVGEIINFKTYVQKSLEALVEFAENN